MTKTRKSPKKTFVFIVNNFWPKIGGLENHVGHLATELSKLGHRCVIVSVDIPPSFQIMGLDLISIPKLWGFGSVFAIPQPKILRKVLTQFKFTPHTYFSTHTRFFPMSWAGVRLGKKMGIPVIHTEHGSSFVAGVNVVVRLLSKFVDYTYGRRTLHGASRVLAVSENVQQFVKKLSGVSSTIFYNAIPAQFHSVAVKRQNSSHPNLVFIGRLVPGKGADTFIEVATLLKQNLAFPEFRAVLIGDGPKKRKLENRVSALGASGYIEVAGAQTPQKIAEVLENAIYINPTTLSEGFQTTLLEAASCGAQIITFPVSGAQALKESGAPISIVNELSAEALYEAILKVHIAPHPVMNERALKKWYWPARAKQFEKLCAETHL